MPRLTQAERLQRATLLRDLAVDLIADGGKRVVTKKRDQTVEFYGL